MDRGVSTFEVPSAPQNVLTELLSCTLQLWRSLVPCRNRRVPTTLQCFTWERDGDCDFASEAWNDQPERGAADIQLCVAVQCGAALSCLEHLMFSSGGESSEYDNEPDGFLDARQQ